MKTYHGAKDGWLEAAAKTRPFGRLIDPKEVARACAYLCSDESGLMTGANIDFDQNVVGTGDPPTRTLSRSRAVAGTPPRRHHDRPLVGRPLWRSGRRPPRGYGELLQGGRRLPDQYRHRHGAARPQERPHHPRRRRAYGPVHPRAMRARRRGRRRDPDGPDAPDLAGAARHPRRERPSRSSSIATIAPTARSTKATSIPPMSRAPGRYWSAARISPAPTPPPRSCKAMRLARAAGRKVVFDIDYRPNLWGLAGHGAGEERYIKSGEVTRSLQRHPAAMRPHRRHRGGDDDRGRGGRSARRAQGGARGEPGDAGAEARPDGLRRVSGRRFLRRSKRGSRARAFRSRSTTCSARATPSCRASCAAGCGTSRSKPAAPTPTPTALSPFRVSCARRNTRPGPNSAGFLKHGSPHRALRHDAALNHIHWATTRRPQPPSIMALAIDHRAQLEKIADDAGAPRERISAFKLLAVEAAAKVAAGRPGYGMLLDGKYGREALFRALDHDFWIARPVEEPGSRPLDFEFGGSLGGQARGMAGRTYDQVPLLLSSRRSARDEGAAGARASAPA